MIEATKYATEAEWLRSREATIGASEVPCLFGVGPARMDPAKMRERLIQEKARGIKRKRSKKDLVRLQAGKVLEARGAVLLGEKLGCHVWPMTFTVYKNDAIPGLHATPDFMLADGIYAEVKAIGPDACMEWGGFTGWQGRWEWNDEAPLYVTLQCHAQMAASNGNRVHEVCVFGTDWNTWTVERDEEVVGMIAAKVAEAISEINAMRAYAAPKETST